LPRKVFAEIDGRPMLDHVIDACRRSADYLNRYTYKTGIAVHVCLVVPTGDEIISHWKHKIQIVEGPEDDVLSRYMNAFENFYPDWLVRVTSDCPLLPPFVISKHIKLAVVNNLDYVSNVDPRFRTALDGADCEVISAKLLKWMDGAADEKREREHVTIAARERPPLWAKVGAVVGFFDESDVKLSVDSQEDLDMVRKQFELVKQKARDAERLYGKENVFRF
jgi:spore coat polysaccharide biosynthesis protein SpsF